MSWNGCGPEGSLQPGQADTNMGYRAWTESRKKLNKKEVGELWPQAGRE